MLVGRRCLRSRFGTAHHSRAFWPPFGSGASPSASAIRLNSTAPEPGNWCRRQLPGRPGDGRKEPFPGRASTWVGRRSIWVDTELGCSVSLPPRNVSLGRRTCASVVVACTLAFSGRGARCVSWSLHCRSSASSSSRPSWSSPPRQGRQRPVDAPRGVGREDLRTHLRRSEAQPKSTGTVGRVSSG